MLEELGDVEMAVTDINQTHSALSLCLSSSQQNSIVTITITAAIATVDDNASTASAHMTVISQVDARAVRK